MRRGHDNRLRLRRLWHLWKWLYRDRGRLFGQLWLRLFDRDRGRLFRLDGCRCLDLDKLR